MDHLPLFPLIAHKDLKKRNTKNLSLQLPSALRGSHSAPNTPPPDGRTAWDNGKISTPYRDAPVQILRNLYLGTETNAADLTVLQRLGIGYVLNVAKEVRNPWELSVPRDGRRRSVNYVPSLLSGQRAALKYKKFPWAHNQDNLQEYFAAAFAFIDEGRHRGTGVLVHCQCGVSRSASVVLAYIMYTLRMPLHEAYSFVKQRSCAISPNMGLVYQLVEFEQSLGLSSRTGREGARLLGEEEGLEAYSAGEQ